MNTDKSEYIDLPVLSMLQPWATLAVRGIKTWETRKRNIGIPIGPLGIHASARRDGLGLQVWVKFCEQYPWLADGLPGWKDLPRGKIIGAVEVSQTMYPLAPGGLSDLEKLLGNYDIATYFAKFLKAVEFETPIPAKGQLSIWKIRVHPCSSVVK